MIDYLAESAYPGGTYSSLVLSASTQEQLYSFCAGLEIPNLVEPGEYHCTLIYSKHPCPAVSDEDFALPCEAMAKGYQIFGQDEKVLVLELYCPNATRLHQLFREKYGAAHDYPSYVPHITIAHNFTGELPVEIPEFEIVFDGHGVEELQ